MNGATLDSTRELLESAVAGLETAIHQLEHDSSLDVQERARLVATIEGVQSRLVREWFGSDGGQDVLF
ncbi:MAG TPA: hypothetical protein PKB03_05930 [Baekduia sp.]|nr:hypothetical protein [Baekduia sp.]